MIDTRHQQNSTPISIAILAGGKSQRMGTDKALLTLRSGGPSLLAIVRDQVRTLSDDLFVVASHRPQYAEFGLPIISDERDNGGPLVGILTALHNAKYARCLIISCDSPFLNNALLTWMIKQPDDCDILVPQLSGESRQRQNGILQTLHAIYHQRCIPAIERQLATGQNRIVDFFPDVSVRVIDEATLRHYDPMLRSFLSINTPELLALAQSITDIAAT